MAQDFQNRPITPGETEHTRRPVLTGLFAEPWWFRLPLALFLVGPMGLTLLVATSEVIRSGDTLFTAIAVFALEPLALFILVTAGALVAPRTPLGNWFLSSRRKAMKLIALWGIAFATITCLVSLGFLE